MNFHSLYFFFEKKATGRSKLTHLSFFNSQEDKKLWTFTHYTFFFFNN